MATDSTLVSTGEDKGNEESPVEWQDCTTEEYQQGYRLYIQHDKVCTRQGIHLSLTLSNEYINLHVHLLVEQRALSKHF